MPLNRALMTYSGQKLLPIYRPEMADELPVNLAPNTRFRRGQIVGQITGSANDVQTLTITGTPTGGTLTVLVRNPNSGGWGTFSLPYNATATVAQGLIRALLGPHITVTGGPLPTTALVFTASGSLINMPLHLMTIDANLLTGGTAPAGAFVKTTNGRSKATFAPRVSGASDGSQISKAIIPYECSTDSAGLVTFGPIAVEGYAGEVFRAAPAYVRGYFDTKTLIGLDATGVGELGRLVSGSVADGVLLVG